MFYKYYIHIYVSLSFMYRHLGVVYVFFFLSSPSQRGEDRIGSCGARCYGGEFLTGESTRLFEPQKDRRGTLDAQKNPVVGGYLSFDNK